MNENPFERVINSLREGENAKYKGWLTFGELSSETGVSSDTIRKSIPEVSGTHPEWFYSHTKTYRLFHPDFVTWLRENKRLYMSNSNKRRMATVLGATAKEINKALDGNKK